MRLRPLGAAPAQAMIERMRFIIVNMQNHTYTYTHKHVKKMYNTIMCRLYRVGRQAHAFTRRRISSGMAVHFVRLLITETNKAKTVTLFSHSPHTKQSRGAA